MVQDYGHMLDLKNPSLRFSILYSDSENEQAEKYYEKELTSRQKRINLNQQITDLSKSNDKRDKVDMVVMLLRKGFTEIINGEDFILNQRQIEKLGAQILDLLKLRAFQGDQIGILHFFI